MLKLVALALFMFTGAGKDSVELVREKEAGTLFAEAQERIESGKAAEASHKLKELSAHYTDTDFVREKTDEINKTRSEILPNILQELVSNNNRSTLKDLASGFELSVPQGWIAIQTLAINGGKRGPGNPRPLKYRLIPAAFDNMMIEIYIEPAKDLEDTASRLGTATGRGASADKQTIETGGLTFLREPYNGGRKTNYYHYSETNKNGYCFSAKAGRSHNKLVRNTLTTLTESIMGTLKTSEAMNNTNAPSTHPPLPGWKKLETERYIFLYTTDDEYVINMSKKLEVMGNQYEKFFSSNGDKDVKGIIKIFDDKEQRNIYFTPPPGMIASYNYQLGEVVAYRHRLRSFAGIKLPEHVDELTSRILFHEVMHLYVDNFYSMKGHPNVVFPPWINEGMGDYFASTIINDSGNITEVKENFVRLDALKRALRTVKKSIRLEEFLKMNTKQYYANGAVNYAIGWSFCYFINEYEGEGAEGYRGFFKTFLSRLDGEGRWVNILTDTIKELGLDLDLMEQRWKEFLQELCSEGQTGSTG